ncbi:hypothetical protein [Nocardia cyriacigeorgica]|uniref:Scaffolding protein n=1 Tax=Nocardia cyriacigeorgica TaxID=135487 RepID=A0A5R8NB24_9NOCA|nr:hypothetical protein [Nocardia cyriacigeorgica]TLF72915.1 hypothetical protein FEK34_28240 [Nocardia cyriacigeorgica]
MNTLLPVHPVFGRALGVRRNGSPIWPIRGASTEGDPPNPAPTGTPPPPPTPAEPEPSGPDELGDGGKKALETERAARKAAEKARREAEAKVQAFEDAQKSEAQRTQERIEQLEKTAAKALRYEAAEKSGLPLSLAGRLSGATLDELIADAAELKQLLGAAAPAEPAAPPTPKPDPRQGGGQADAGGSMDSGRAAYQARKNRN